MRHATVLTPELKRGVGVDRVALEKESELRNEKCLRCRPLLCERGEERVARLRDYAVFHSRKVCLIPEHGPRLRIVLDGLNDVR